MAAAQAISASSASFMTSRAASKSTNLVPSRATSAPMDRAPRRSDARRSDSFFSHSSSRIEVSDSTAAAVAAPNLGMPFLARLPLSVTRWRARVHHHGSGCLYFPLSHIPAVDAACRRFNSFECSSSCSSSRYGQSLPLLRCLHHIIGERLAAYPAVRTRASSSSSSSPGSSSAVAVEVEVDPSVLAMVQSTIAEKISEDVSAVTADAKLSDLGIDSLDQVEIMMAFEEKCGVTVDDGSEGSGAEAMKTVRDVAIYLEQLIAKKEGN